MEDNQDSELHPIDEWDQQAEKSQAKFNSQVLQDSSLVYQVFTTQAGELLLQRWMEALIWTASASGNDDYLAIGLKEGEKKFVRSIMKSIKIHEEQQ